MSRFSLRVDPDALDRAAATLTSLAERLGGVRDRTGSARTSAVAGWEGRSADSWLAELDALGTLTAEVRPLLRDAGATVRVFAGEVRTAAEVTVPQLERQWDAADDAYAGALGRARAGRDADVSALSADLTVGERQTQVDDLRRALGRATDAAVDAREAERKRLETAYDDMLADLRQQARALGGTLAAAVLVAAPRHLAHPSRPGVPYAMSPLDFRDLVRDTLAARLPAWGAAHTQHEAGREAADQFVADLVDPGSDAFDAAVAGLTGASDAFLAGLAERVGELPTDITGPALAAATSYLAEGLDVGGADRLATLLRVVGLTPPATAAAWADELGADGLTSLTHRLGTLGHDGVRGTSVEELDAARTAQDAVLAGLGAAFGRATHGGTDVTTDLLEQAAAGGGWALSQLLRATTGADPDWLRDTADAVLALEQGQLPGFWGSRQPQPYAGWSPVLGHGDAGGAYDPMTGLMHALADQPDVALEWIGGDVDRYTYLLDERTWRSDEGDGLGEALEAATIAGRASDPEAAAMLASRVVHTFGTTLVADRWPNPWAGGEAMVYPDILDSLGLMLGEYARDVDFSVQDPELEGDPPGTSDVAAGNQAYRDARTGAVFATDALTRLVSAISGDDAAVAALALGIADVSDARLQHGVALDGAVADGTTTSTVTALRNSARIEGWLVDAITGGRHSDGSAADARTAFVVKVLTAPVGLVPTGGGVAGLAGGLALEESTQRVSAFLATDHAAQAIEDGESLVTLRQEGIFVDSAQALVDAGVLSGEDLDGWPTEAGQPVPVAEMTVEQREQWSLWRQGSAANDLRAVIDDQWDDLLSFYGRL